MCVACLQNSLVQLHLRPITITNSTYMTWTIDYETGAPPPPQPEKNASSNITAWLPMWAESAQVPKWCQSSGSRV